jgi:hypothetical protein
MDGNHLFTEYFFSRIAIDIIAMIILIRVVYYSTYNKRDTFFTFFLLNFIVFLLTYMIEVMKAFNSFGSAIGLLAAFALLRFRTETMSLKDMTYLFVIMALGLINSIMKGSYVEILSLNAMIISAVYVVDGNQLMKNQKNRTLEFDKLDNIRPDRQALLIAELRERTGLDIRKISIEHIDFVKGRVVVKIYYY